MSSSNATRAEQRRRILRAAVGVPVVYTLSSGAALAQGSLSCAEKSLTLYQEQQPALFAATDDEFLRVALPTFSFKIANPSGPGNLDVIGFQYPAGTWYYIDIQGNQAFAAVPRTTPKPITNGVVHGLLHYQDISGVRTLTLVPTILASEINPLAGASCATSLGVTVAGASGGFLDAI
jgi:hypothetical protein